MLRRAAGLMQKAAAHTYATWNPADNGGAMTLSNGDLTAAANGSGGIRSTIGKSSGKWYWECTGSAGVGFMFGIAKVTVDLTSATFNQTDTDFYYYDGNRYVNGSPSAFGASYTTSDVIGVALDMDGGTIKFYKNNVLQGTSLATGLSGTFFACFCRGTNPLPTMTVNFGATALTYAPPSGYNAGLY